IDAFTIIEGLTTGGVRIRSIDVTSITIKGGSGGNTFLVQNTTDSLGGPQVNTSIMTGAGSDSVRVYATRNPLAVTLRANASLTTENPDTNLADITSAITVTGAGAGMNNVINVADVGNTNPDTYTATDTSLSNSAHTIVNFSGIDSLELWESAVAGTTLNDT